MSIAKKSKIFKAFEKHYDFTNENNLGLQAVNFNDKLNIEED